ncbi:hypothetical protein [Streptomyces phaeochromogenes]
MTGWAYLFALPSFIHPGGLGQMVEVGRDQGHALLSVGQVRPIWESLYNHYVNRRGLNHLGLGTPGLHQTQGDRLGHHTGSFREYVRHGVLLRHRRRGPITNTSGGAQPQGGRGGS